VEVLAGVEGRWSAWKVLAVVGQRS
jgi:hypothetical protein